MADRALLERILGPLREKILLLVSRAVVRRIQEGGGLVQLEGIGGEISDRVERWGVVGVASHPMPGSETLVAAVGGSRSHLVAFAGDDRARRPTDLEEGELRLYAPDGSAVLIKLVHGELRLEASGAVTIEAPEIVLGEALPLALMNASLVAWLEAHEHPGTDPPTTPVPATALTTVAKAT